MGRRGGDISQARRSRSDHRPNERLLITKSSSARNEDVGKGASATTIDLVLASNDLASNVAHCTTSEADHGSDHRKIETTLDLSIPDVQLKERLLLRNVPWKEINTRIAHALQTLPAGETVQEKTVTLISAVCETVHMLTPKAKTSPHAKR